MAVQSNRGYGFHYEYNDDGSTAAPLVKVELGSNVGCKVGDPIRYHSTGLGLVGTNQAIFGFAVEEVTAEAGVRQNVLCVAATPEAIFSGKTDGAGAITLRGALRKMIGTTGEKLVDDDGGPTGAVFRIIGRHPMSSDWGTNAQLLLKVVSSQYAGTNITPTVT